MANYGILVDYKWCSGCKSCELACQMEHDLAPERSGVRVYEVGPWRIEGERWQHDYVPAFTDECDLCGARVGSGKLPSCVQHCQANILEFGEVSELAARMDGKQKQSLIIP
jgi:anaerobic dimethyl sulfoxide reductase subunit B (iron-sulfur subunit)